MNGRKLVSLYTEGKDRNTVSVSFADYSGHRAKGNGCHYTASHRANITTDTLYRLLDEAGLFQHSPGNEPDMRLCDHCKQEYFSDKLDMIDLEDDYIFLCQQCKSKLAERSK